MRRTVVSTVINDLWNDSVDLVVCGAKAFVEARGHVMSAKGIGKKIGTMAGPAPVPLFPVKSHLLRSADVSRRGSVISVLM